MIIPYDNPNITYLGRFLTPTAYMQSAWQGNHVRFKTRGTSSITFTCDIKSIADGAFGTIATNIDNALTTVSNALSSASEVFTGERSVTIGLPDTNLHDILVKLSANMPTNQYTGTAYVRLKSITIDDGGEILPWTQENRLLMTIGDSWMAAWHDWPRLMDGNKYGTYPLAFGGAVVSNLDAYYSTQASGVAKYGDPIMDGVLISFGVNDFNAGVTTAGYKASMGSLIDKVRVDQPNSLIFLIQTPRNIGASKNYDQYGTVLGELATEKTNVIYITTETIWSSLTWLGDTAHLDASGKQIFANFVVSRIDPYMLPQVESISFMVYGTKYTLPTYLPSDLVENRLRITGKYGTRCLKLVEVTDGTASPLRVKTWNGIKAIAQ